MDVFKAFKEIAIWRKFMEHPHLEMQELPKLVGNTEFCTEIVICKDYSFCIMGGSLKYRVFLCLPPTLIKLHTCYPSKHHHVNLI